MRIAGAAGAGRDEAANGTARARLLGLVAVLALLLTACSSGPSSAVAWRDLSLTLPDGWVVAENRSGSLIIADKPLPANPDDFASTADSDPDPDLLPEVGLYFTHEPNTVPGDWRELVTGALDGTIEADNALTIDGVPATQLVFSHASNGVSTREMVIVIPARGIVVLAQPIGIIGRQRITNQPSSEIGPVLYDAHVDEFAAIIASFAFGAPVG